MIDFRRLDAILGNVSKLSQQKLYVEFGHAAFFLLLHMLMAHALALLYR